MKFYYFYHFTSSQNEKNLVDPDTTINATGCGELGLGFYTWGKQEAAELAAPDWAKNERWKGWSVIRFAVPESVLLESSLFYGDQKLSDRKDFMDHWFEEVETEEIDDDDDETDLAEGVTSLQVTNSNNNNNNAVTNSSVTTTCSSSNATKSEMTNEEKESDDEEDDISSQDDDGQEYEHEELNVLFFSDKKDTDVCREASDKEKRQKVGYEISWKDFVERNEGTNDEKYTDWKFDIIIGPHKGKVNKFKGVPFQYAFNEAIDILNDKGVTRTVVKRGK